MTAAGDFIFLIFREAWQFLSEASPYILFGLLTGGLVKVFLSTEFIAEHLGRGRFLPVLKAALLGIPLPLCSCGVLPAASALKKGGANNGATMAFLVSTPESGVDSISISYALLDPIMTVARPVAGFLTAVVAGVAENLMGPAGEKHAISPRPASLRPVGDCGCGPACGNGKPAHKTTCLSKIKKGLLYAVNDLWGDMAGWFFLGIFLAGVIAVLVPDDLASRYLGGGLEAMLVMLVVGIPLYICATASTPIAAALIFKGVSPGAALVFLLAGPATNITSLSVLLGIFGKRATAIYLSSIAVISVLCGVTLDAVYAFYALSPKAAVGQGGEFLPAWIELVAAAVVLLLSFRTFWAKLRQRRKNRRQDPALAPPSCRCGGECRPVVLRTQVSQADIATKSCNR
jgi:uncharacterized membrane protein YraQ (UPF0718 family)